MTESEDSVSTASPTASPSASSPSVLPKSPLRKEVPVMVRRPTITHPSNSVMVTAAIKALNDKKGSTLQAIKKYITIHYQVDTIKTAPFIRKYLKAAVIKGDLIQTNGNGANGNFKLPVEKKTKTKKTINAAPDTKKKKPGAKKPTATKAPAVVTSDSDKKRSTGEEKTTLPNAKKLKKVTTAVVKPKSRTTKKVAAVVDSTAKTKVESADIKTKASKVVVKKAPAKKKVAVPKKK